MSDDERLEFAIQKILDFSKKTLDSKMLALENVLMTTLQRRNYPKEKFFENMNLNWEVIAKYLKEHNEGNE